jgi:hypothetical protein
VTEPAEADHADLRALDLVADGADPADDLVAGDDRPGLVAPLAADEVQVGVADAAVEDIDRDVAGARLAALDGRWGGAPQL